MNEEEKQPTEDSSKKAVKTGLKAVGNAKFGAVGGKAVDALAQTKEGNKALDIAGGAIDKNPILKKAASDLDKKGALDAADQAMDAGALGGAGGTAPSQSGSAPLSSSSLPGLAGGFLGNSNNKQASTPSDTEETEVVDDSALTRMSGFAKKHKFKFIIIGFSAILTVGAIALLISVILSVAQNTIDFFQEGWDTIKNLIDGKSTEEWELKYQETLKEVQEKLNDKYSVCIDVNLITATLTSNITSDEYIEEGKEVETDTPEGSELGLTGDDYKKMIKQVEILGNMQIRRTIYGLDERVKAANAGSGIANDYCQDEASEYLVETEEDINHFSYESTTMTNLFSTLKHLGVGDTVRVSTTPREVASNDMIPGIFKLFTKKANEDKNIEYKFYVPAYIKEEKRDADGNVIKDANGNPIIEKKCKAETPYDYNDFAKLDIGSLKDMTNNIYYWNLVDSFVTEYYSNYLPKGNDKQPELNTERYQKIKSIVDDIYVLYNETGPNQSCKGKKYICRIDEGSGYYGGGTSLKRTEFIERIAPFAIEEMSRTGVLASVTIAQAAVESADGSSYLSSQYANYYGMTAGSCAPGQSPSNYSGTVLAAGQNGNSCQGNAFWDGTIVAMCNRSGQDCQWYRVYDSFENSTRDHSRLLTEAYKCTGIMDHADLISCLVNKGYATASTYQSTLLGVIKDNDLTQYDIGVWNGTITEITDNQYTDAICYYGGGSMGDWATWKQTDPRWKDTPFGNTTLGPHGCAVTSVAIQIMRSGVSTTLGSNFNPGTFATALDKAGGFDSRSFIQWGMVEKIAPSFKFSGREHLPPQISQLESYINQGYYIILNVKNGAHWVAVDRIEGNKIHMFDSGSTGTEVGATYGLNTIVGYALYKVG